MCSSHIFAISFYKSSNTDTYSYGRCLKKPRNYRRKKKREQLTEKSNSKPLQNASALPKEEITPSVCQETYYSTGERDQEVCDGQINYDIVQGLSELFVLEGDKHDEEVFAQGQRGDHKHEHGQDGEVPRRDVLDGSIERITGGGQFGCHGVGHGVD